MLTRSRRIASKSSRILSVGAAGSRALSSSTLPTEEVRVAEIKMPRVLSEEFLDIVAGHYEGFTDDGYSLKPLSIEEGEAGYATLDRLIRRDSDLSKAFEKARKDDTLVSIVEGIAIPEMPKTEIPTHITDLNTQRFKKLIRPAEIIMYAYNRLLGLSTHDSSYEHGSGIITSVFATKADERSDSSYRSSEELKWHNDGWSLEGLNIDDVSLLGIVGKEGIRTEVVLVGDIIKHFKESGKEDLLNTLGKESLIEGADEFFAMPTKIIDIKEETMKYAEYGCFIAERYSDIAKLFEAIQFLNKTLEVVPSVSLEIDKGDLLSINNRKTIHRKINTNSTPDNIVDSAVGERLLLRQFGSKQDGERS